MDIVNFITNLCAAGVARGTPLLFAASGEIITERSGILNLGIEGMMLVGAMTGYGTALITGNTFLGVLCAVFAAGILSLLHAFVTITLKGDQVVSGLALVFLGTGFSAVAGASLVNSAAASVKTDILPIPILSRLPILGEVFFMHNAFVYLGFILVPMTWLLLFKTRTGLHIRACGENPRAAYSMGIPVTKIQYFCVFAGGCFSGLAGASLSLAITPGWVEGITSGQGWIAIGLVIFARWGPWKALLGAYLFGAIRRLPLDLQGIHSVPILQSPGTGFFLNMLPYLFCILALLVSGRHSRKSSDAPASIGKPFIH